MRKVLISLVDHRVACFRPLLGARATLTRRYASRGRALPHGGAASPRRSGRCFPKALPEENVAEGRGRGLVQMLSGAVLLFLIGGMPFNAGRLAFTYFSFVYRDLLVPDDEEDEQPLTARQLNDIFEQEVALPDRLPESRARLRRRLRGPSSCLEPENHSAAKDMD